jgi:hypothetical protein
LSENLMMGLTATLGDLLLLRMKWFSYSFTQSITAVSGRS